MMLMWVAEEKEAPAVFRYKLSTWHFLLFQVIEDNEISDEKMKLKQNIEGMFVFILIPTTDSWKKKSTPITHTSADLLS